MSLSAQTVLVLYPCRTVPEVTSQPRERRWPLKKTLHSAIATSMGESEVMEDGRTMAYNAIGTRSSKLLSK